MAGPGMETPNELMVVFSNTVTAGFDALSGSVNGVFGLLIALVVALTGIQWALSPNREVLASGFGKVLLIGAFAWIINDWQALSETIYAGFLELGLTAGGGSRRFGPCPPVAFPDTNPTANVTSPVICRTLPGSTRLHTGKNARL